MPQLHDFMIGRTLLTKKVRIAGVLFHDPFGRRGAISPACAGQIEDKIGMLVEPMLAANGLNIVAVQKTPAEPTIQLSQKILLAPRLKPIPTPRLESGCCWISHNPHRLQIWGSAVLRAELRPN